MRRLNQIWVAAVYNLDRLADVIKNARRLPYLAYHTALKHRVSCNSAKVCIQTLITKSLHFVFLRFYLSKKQLK